VPLTPDQWIEQRLTPEQLSVYEHHKDNFLKLEPIFKILQISPRITGFMKALARRTSIRRSTFSMWKANLLTNPSWRPMRIHYSLHRRAFTDEQERELATGIAVSYIEKGLFPRMPILRSTRSNFVTRLKPQQQKRLKASHHSTTVSPWSPLPVSSKIFAIAID
jgi:hypothetical protein